MGKLQKDLGPYVIRVLQDGYAHFPDKWGRDIKMTSLVEASWKAPPEQVIAL